MLRNKSTIKSKHSKKPFGIRGKRSMNPNRRKMSVSFEGTYEQIHSMNQKALKLVAKRA